MPTKIIIQRVSEANLVNIGTIKEGIMLYVSFLKNTKKTEVETGVEKLFSAELKDKKTLSELNWELMIIPQASIGGKLKGKRFQYHSLISKQLGLEFYTHFVDLCKKKMDGKNFIAGVFGNIQELEFRSSGPYTHSIEI